MQTTKPGFRLPLGAQIFLVCATLITLAVGAAVAITLAGVTNRATVPALSGGWCWFW